MADNAHVFVVDATTFPVHRDRLFCGVKNPANDNTRFGLYADLFAIRPGDVIYFYQSRIDESRQDRGFRGIYKAISRPFFDMSGVPGRGESKGLKVLGACPKCKKPYSLKSGKAGGLGPRKCPVCKSEHGEHILPNRVLIEPVAYYPAPVDDNTAYINHTNHGMLWTMLFRKTFGAGRARSITHILPEERDKLRRLLSRVNSAGEVKGYPFDPYRTPQEAARKSLRLTYPGGPELQYESMLEAWFMANIDGDVPVLRSVLGPKEELEYWGNNVLYGIGGEKVDVLCLHNRKGIRYKATVVELKKGPITGDALTQIDDYGYWVAQLATAYLLHNIPKLEIQPVLVGRGTRPKVVDKIAGYRPQSFDIPLTPPCKITVGKPILLEYELAKNAVNLEKVIEA